MMQWWSLQGDILYVGSIIIFQHNILDFSTLNIFISSKFIFYNLDTDKWIFHSESN